MSDTPQNKFYRFRGGHFIQAATFEEAKQKHVQQIQNEKENPNNWSKCDCQGWYHRRECPEWVMCD